MSKEQIEEMANDLRKAERLYFDENSLTAELDERKTAKNLYNAGYRKQREGEWIRYPHGSGIYCSLCKHKRRYRDINDAYCPNCGATMKGGAE